MEIQNELKCSEAQYMRQWWMMLALIVSDLIMIATIFGIIHTNKSGQFTVGIPAVLVMIVLTALIYFAHLKTEVRNDGLYIRFVPFHSKWIKIPLENAASIEAITYNPLLNYGGWGIRYTANGKAYNPTGNRGVKISYTNGKHILIGSQKPEELAEAIKTIP